MNSVPTTPTAKTPPDHKGATSVMPSFHQKSTIVSLVVIASISLYFFAQVLEVVRSGALPETGAMVPPGYSGFVFTTIALTILVEIVLQAVLAFGADSVPAATSRDRDASRRAQRNGYGVLVAGVFLTFSSLFWNPSPFVMGNLLLLGFVLAELIRLASQLFYSRQA